MPTTVAIDAACDALDNAIKAFLKARSSIKGYAQYESTSEALNLFYLTIRQIESVMTLARTDLVFLPAANACARAALETAAKAAWMVDENDPYVRETRYLAHLQEEERVYERSSKQYAALGMSNETFKARQKQLRSFRTGVEESLPSHIKPLKHNPKMDEILLSLRGKQLYPIYILLSQYVHGGHEATWLYRRNLGTSRKFGEFIEQKHWFLPLRTCWISLNQPGSLMLWRLGRKARSFISKDAAAHVEALVEAVNKS